MLSRPKQSAQVTVGILSILAVAALAVLLGWLAVQFTAELTRAFEVIADIVGWILLPLARLAERFSAQSHQFSEQLAVRVV